MLRPGEIDEKLEQILEIIASDQSDIQLADDVTEITENLMSNEGKETITKELTSSSDEEKCTKSETSLPLASKHKE